MERSVKAVWSASTCTVETEYKPGSTEIIAFGKTARIIIKQGFDDMGCYSWMAFEGETNKVVLIISIYQCCKQPINPTGIIAYHQ